MKKLFDTNFQKNGNFNLPSYTHSEEILNVITHGAGIIFSICAAILLFGKMPHASEYIRCTAVYCFTLFVMYSVSTLYHAIKVGRSKAVFRKFDHCSIFLLIAGTYTPICALYVGNSLSRIILSCIWIVALVGIILNIINVDKFSKISLACYIIMGWSVVFMIKPVVENLNASQLRWLLYGGIFYTIGAVIYVIGKKVKYMHSIWHFFVLAGSACHFMVFY